MKDLKNKLISEKLLTLSRSWYHFGGVDWQKSEVSNWCLIWLKGIKISPKNSFRPKRSLCQTLSHRILSSKSQS